MSKGSKNMRIIQRWIFLTKKICKNWKNVFCSVFPIEHRCTPVKNPGEGVRDVFAKIPRRVKAFWKNCLWGSPYFGFYCILLTSFSKICLGSPPGVAFSSPPHPPVCIYAIETVTYKHRNTEVAYPEGGGSLFFWENSAKGVFGLTENQGGS
jgi:hypothetical protein